MECAMPNELVYWITSVSIRLVYHTSPRDEFDTRRIDTIVHQYVNELGIAYYIYPITITCC